MADTMSWQRVRGAPDSGAVIARTSDLPEDGTLAVTYSGKGRDFPILMVRRGEAFAAFLNACPHQGLPLTFRSEDVTTADGQRLMCSNHHAEFDLLTGEGVAGFGQGCALMRIPLSLDAEGLIRVA
jgi:nitrite reductase/ring-hydroxylating ferredoxin subunit